MITDLIYNKDKYYELFASVINLLEDGSLTPSPDLREFINIVEIARSKANSVIRRAIRKAKCLPLKKINSNDYTRRIAKRAKKEPLKTFMLR